MFRPPMCPSSGETTVCMRHLVLVILYGWLSGMQEHMLLSGWLSGMLEDMLLCGWLSGWLSGMHEHMLLCGWLSGWLSGMQEHMLLCGWLSGWLSGMHEHIILCGWLSGWLSGMQEHMLLCGWLSGWLSGMQEHMLLYTRQSSIQNNKYQVSHKYSTIILCILQGVSLSCNGSLWSTRHRSCIATDDGTRFCGQSCLLSLSACVFGF